MRKHPAGEKERGTSTIRIRHSRLCHNRGSRLLLLALRRKKFFLLEFTHYTIKRSARYFSARRAETRTHSLESLCERSHQFSFMLVRHCGPRIIVTSARKPDVQWPFQSESRLQLQVGVTSKIPPNDAKGSREEGRGQKIRVTNSKLHKCIFLVLIFLSIFQQESER